MEDQDVVNAGDRELYAHTNLEILGEGHAFLRQQLALLLDVLVVFTDRSCRPQTTRSSS